VDQADVSATAFVRQILPKAICHAYIVVSAALPRSRGRPIPSTFKGIRKALKISCVVVPLFSEGAFLSLKPKLRISRLRTVGEESAGVPLD